MRLPSYELVFDNEFPKFSMLSRLESVMSGNDDRCCSLSFSAVDDALLVDKCLIFGVPPPSTFSLA